MCGCSGEDERSTAPAQPFPGAGEDCPTEEPQPVTPGRAVDALTASGFSVRFDAEACGLGEIAGMLSNASSANALEREGVVVCFLFARPRDGTVAPDVRGDREGAHAELSYANLSCDLYAMDVHADDELSRFEQAFERLQP